MINKVVRRLGVREALAGKFLIACMTLGFLSLLAAGLTAAWYTARNEDHTDWVNHTYEVELAISRASILIEQAETSRRGYLLTRDTLYRDAYRTAVAALPATMHRIQTLTLDNPRQQANFADLVRRSTALRRLHDRTIALVDSGQAPQAQALFAGETAARRMYALRQLERAMVDEERRLLAVRDAVQRESVRAFYLILGIAGVLLLVVAISALATILRYTRELATSRDVLRDFADSLEDQVQERTADLSRANEEIQRFAYIVSHDLRSPLVNVMGFTAELASATAAITELIDRAEEVAPEIVTEDARLAAREDLPEAIGFIRTSTQKMDRLINAILKLSREGRRVLAPVRIDMRQLVGGIRDSLKHRLDGEGTEIVIDPTLPRLVSDRLAIEQIFSNLIENAVKYLQPGRPGVITVRGRRVGSRIFYDVEDNGRGIAANDHSRVFDLFRRSGQQDQPGEGIGLAHVRALAYRLGGTIELASELGKGATFTLSLPAAPGDIQDLPE